MKLLIIDDEELTRTGILNSLNWRALGIETVLQADDGVHGMEMARLHKPDIILCDVRMPRMDGITMLAHLESFLPDSVVIFMSGYSDKEYLKAAIRFKAVRYVEKPFQPPEMEEAARMIAEKRQMRRGNALLSREASSRLAYCLTEPYAAHREEIGRLADELSLVLDERVWFRAIIIKMEPSVDLGSFSKEMPGQKLQALAGGGMRIFSVIRHQENVVYMLMSPAGIDGQVLDAVVSVLKKSYAACGRFYLTVGDAARGVRHAYDSFASAVVRMQSSFFFDAGTVLTADMAGHAQTGTEEPAFEAMLRDALHSGDSAQCEACLRLLWERYERNTAVLPDVVKELYFKLLLLVENTGARLDLTAEPSEESTVSALERCFTYRELHALLAGKVEAFLKSLSDRSQENVTISLIKSYIARHYQETGLSVRDVAAHVYLSASYVCTFFKNGTGRTLNQYITEYRMEKAKELLCDPRHKITDISAKVGYSDGNYFGKSFKKYTGFSPSEFRERMMR